MTPIFSFSCLIPSLPLARAGVLRAAAALIAGVAALAGALPAAAQDHHPQIATLVKNLDQQSGPDIRTVLSRNQNGLMQGFRTGPNRGGYELESIWLYVRDTHESRYMTIRADVYRDTAMRHKVATLTRGQLNDYAHNEWKAGANTYLEPDTDYWFVLDCVSGCANDNWAQFGTTYSEAEDGGDEPGWSIHDRMRFRRPDDGWFRDNNEALRIRIRGRASPYRAYRTEIVSTPRDGRTYHYGEHIDIALTFNVAVYVPESGSVIAIRVGDTADGSNYRAAEYHSGSLTDRLVYRYQVQLGDADTDGISVDAGGPNSGFGGTVPTIVASFGLLPVHDFYPGVADDSRHRVSGEFHVHDVSITSSPEHEDGYRVGEDIEVAVKFSIEAYATGASVLAIRVGDSAPDNYRPAKYVAGSGTDRLTYRYRVQLDDYDADGISVDAGGPPSGFGGTLPTTSPELGSVPVSRDFSRVPDDAGHKVDGAVIVLFGARAYVIAEGGPAVDVTVLLTSDPAGEVVIPITATPGGGATPADYTVAPTVLSFAPGETRRTVTVAAVDDSEVDGGESVRLGFGTLPDGIRHGHQFTVFVIEDNDGLAPIVDITDVDGGAEPGSVGFTVTLSGPGDVDITVDWCISDSAAGAGADCAASGTITIPAGETTATVTVPVGEDAIGDPDRIFSVTLSNPVNAEFSAGAVTIAAQLAVQEGSVVDPSAPVVEAVPDTAGNLIVSWEAPEGASPRGYQVQYRVRGTESWEPTLSTGAETHVPILFLEQDTEYEARVRSIQHGADNGRARTYSPWSEPGYGRTGTHQEGSEPVLTLALPDSEPAIEGEHALVHIVVSELRNSYQWHGYDAGISVGVKYGWRTGGNVLPASSLFGIVPGVFTVDHGLGGYRERRVQLWDYVADHGPLTITLQPGEGYRVGDADSVCVRIADSETLEATPCPDSEETDASASDAVSLAVQDAQATEGVDGVISFEVTLSASAGEPVTVDWATADGTATAGEDYVASSGTITFESGETAYTIEVTVLDDAHDEGSETFALRLSNAVGAELDDAEATGTIVNSDPMPRAWLGRFGRTAWEHTLDAVDQRLRSAGNPATRTVVAGHEMTAAGAKPAAEDQAIAALAAWIDTGNRDPEAGSIGGQELLTGSEFQVATGAGEDGGAALTVWGQGAYGHFAGRDGDLAVDGEVATGTLGVDYAAGPWMAGLALSHSAGRGSYAQPMTSGGEVSSSLTGAYPYVGFEVVPERLSLWLAGGYGLGGLQLTPTDGDPLETRINLLAGAAGVRGTVVPASATGGFSLDVNADGMLLRAASESAPGLVATAAEVNRIRLGLEGSYEAALGGGARLTPSIEVGVRRDGGDAEIGFGMDVGGGLSFTQPEIGLSLGLKGRALVLHETAEVAEWGASGWLAWDPNPGSELGPALTVSPSIGTSAEGGAAALWSRGTLAGLDGDPMDVSGTGRVDARFGYGLDLMGGVGTPWAGIGLSEREREYRLGYEFHARRPAETEVRVGLVATRREPVNAAPEHTLSVQSTVSW